MLVRAFARAAPGSHQITGTASAPAQGQTRNTYGHNWSTKQISRMECINGEGIAEPTEIGSNIGSLPGSGRQAVVGQRCSGWRCSCSRSQIIRQTPNSAQALNSAHILIRAIIIRPTHLVIS